MSLDLNTLINLGILSILAFLVRAVYALREDVRGLKKELGVNGSSQTGLVHEVGKLREARHDHANQLTSLRFQVDDLIDWRDRQ